MKLHRSSLFARLAAVAFLAATAVLVLGAMHTANADAAFQKWVRDFRNVAARSGVSTKTYDAVFATISAPDRDIIGRMGNQAEFEFRIWDYMDSSVSEERVKNGREMRRKWANVLSQIERRYHVDRDVVLAVWGMETRYGGYMGDHNVIEALATLAYGAPRRKKFWRSELINALKIVQAGHIRHADMVGSWAGAMGHTQFMPSSWQKFAADYDNDGRKDIWTNIPDALASTANYLNRHGWQTGKTWGYEVRLPAGFNKGLEGKDGITLGKWQSLGVRRVNGKPFPRGADRAVLKFPGGKNGPAFLMLRNFYIIKRYNNSDAYALAVGHLADRIAGFGPFVQEWPRGYTPLDDDGRKEVQQRLKALGFYDAPVSGAVGPKTRKAISDYQKRAGIEVNGEASAELLKHLRGG